MKEIILECGSVVFVDEDDFDYITHLYNLSIDKNGYVQCSLKKRYRNKDMGLYANISLHKLLIHPDKSGRQINVDHKDKNKLNNTKYNLRLCLHKDNMKNRKSHGGTSQYKGVHWNTESEVWKVRIYNDDKYIGLGRFTNEIAAANCYNHWARFYHKEFAQLNEVPYMPKEEWMKYKKGKTKTSQYIGVSLVDNKWVVQIWNGKTNTVIGRFEDENEAALAYNQAAIKLKGDKAKLNIIK
jgi:hypothetical protein